MKASAWIETNRSALTLRALATRPMQRDEIIAVADQHAAHVRRRHPPVLSALRAIASVTFFRCEPFLPRAPGSSPPCPASIAMISVRARSSGTFWALRRRWWRGDFAGARLCGRLGLSSAAAVSRLAGCGGCAGGFGQRLRVVRARPSRVKRLGGIHVQHQAIAVFADRLEVEQLRLDLALQVEHQAHHAGFETPDAHALDVGVVVADLVWRAPSARRRVRHLPGRSPGAPGSYGEHIVADGLSGFERQPRVILRWPDARRADGDGGMQPAPATAAERQECCTVLQLL